ncbi:unnamed protein product [Meganyctiphanes norvegica]|uniref:6-phosphofructo-2-kinase n=2 Tax=Meganyctiphanes norvegica TaxID=48144 RepID=A0AAV2Q7K4_MEGNR
MSQNGNGRKYPIIRSKHSLVAKYVTPEIWTKLCEHYTPKTGFTLGRAIACSVEFDNQHCGIYAGDYDSYTDFAEVFDPIIQEYHGIDPQSMHTTDMDIKKIKGNINPDVPVQYIRIRVCRSINDFGLPPGMGKDECIDVENLMKSAFTRMIGDLAGNYYPLTGMDENIHQQLRDDHFLFMAGDPNHKVGGMERNWPKGRGVFHNAAKSFLVWVNEEDHVRAVSTELGGDIKSVFSRLINGVNAIEESIIADSDKGFCCDPKYGYIQSCPTNLGTGMIVSVHVDLPGWSKEGIVALKTRCTQLLIEPIGIRTGNTYKISSKHCLGYSEVEIIQGMIDGINALYKEDIQLQKKHEIFPYFPMIKSKDSLVAKHVNETIFKKLGAHKTATTGFTLQKAIACATTFYNQQCGIYAGDWDSYRDFAAIFDPIIQEYHGIVPGAKHTSDMNFTKIHSKINPQAPVHSVRIRAGRTIDGFGLPPGITREQRLAVENLMKKVFNDLTGDLSGHYFPLMGMEEKQRRQLVDNHVLFMSGDPNHKVAGMERDWPEGRGIFHNEAKSFIIWVNEEDQLMIISMEKGCNVRGVFERLARGIKSVEDLMIGESGRSFALDPKYGYIHSCPTNLGTGMRASVHIDLPGWAKEGHVALKARCKQLKLECRGSQGESKAQKGITFDISNKHRLGYSEVELVQCMIDGVNMLYDEDLHLQEKHQICFSPSCVSNESSESSASTTEPLITPMETHKAFAGRGQQDYINIPHVVVMVGLPARGKTYMARKLTHYLNWVGIKTRVFNLGDYRRKAEKESTQHNFFRGDNTEGLKLREKCAIAALNDMCNWIKLQGGEVGVFDATNTTIDRRNLIYKTIVEKKNFKLLFVESICNDPKIIEENIKDVKVNGPDYENVTEEEAFKDFMQRIAHYEQVYQTIDEEKEGYLSFMKIYDAGRKVVIHQSDGHIQARIVYFFMNIHINTRHIYLSRHGESVLNTVGRIGGNSDLSDRGREYSKALASYIKSQYIEKLRVWTSYYKRTIQTASLIDAPQERWKALNEVNAGECEEMTYHEIADKFPMEFAARDIEKYHYRYPSGESYEDLVARLEPVIMELERQKNVLVISHQAVLRCLLGYFCNKSTDELPYIKVPLHTIIKLTPMAKGCHVEYIPLGIKAVDTHRAKPDVPGTIENNTCPDEFFEDYLY